MELIRNSHPNLLKNTYAGIHLTQKGAQAVADAIRMQVGEEKK